MKNLWNDGEAEKLVADYAKKGVARDLALMMPMRQLDARSLAQGSRRV